MKKIIFNNHDIFDKKNKNLSFIYNENDLIDLSTQIKNYILKFKNHILLDGDIGSGKTTLIRSLIEGFKKNIIVNSPTYTYLNIYDLGDFTINHFDLYRLENFHEFERLGFNEYLNIDNGICLFEWPKENIIKNINNHKFLNLKLMHNTIDNRIISVSL